MTHLSSLRFVVGSYHIEFAYGQYEQRSNEVFGGYVEDEQGEFPLRMTSTVSKVQLVLEVEHTAFIGEPHRPRGSDIFD